jgi:hypothetical protein
MPADAIVAAYTRTGTLTSPNVIVALEIDRGAAIEPSFALTWSIETDGDAAGPWRRRAGLPTARSRSTASGS